MILKGRVSATDMADGEFELELADETKLKAPLEHQHHDTVIQAMKEYGDNRMLAVKGVVRKNKKGNLKRFDSVEHANPLHPLDVETRLEELAKLNDKWSPRPSPHGSPRLAPAPSVGSSRRAGRCEDAHH